MGIVPGLSIGSFLESFMHTGFCLFGGMLAGMGVGAMFGYLKGDQMEGIRNEQERQAEERRQGYRQQAVDSLEAADANRAYLNSLRNASMPAPAARPYPQQYPHQPQYPYPQQHFTYQPQRPAQQQPVARKDDQSDWLNSLK